MSAVGMCLTAVIVSSCVHTTDGSVVAVDGAGPRTPPPSGSAAAPAPAAPVPDGPAYGVVPTVRTPVPAGSVTCAPQQKPRVGFVATVADAAAPVITVPVPDGW